MHSFARLFDAAAMIHFHVAQTREVSEALRVYPVERSAESSEAFEQVAEQVACAKRFRQGVPFELVHRYERNQVICALDLLFEFCEYQQGKIVRIVHRNNSKMIIKNAIAVRVGFIITNTLDIEVHLKLKRVRAHANRVNFFLPFVGYPPVNERFGEDIAFEQKVVIGFERFERAV